MNTISKLMGGGLLGLALTGACAGGNGGTQIGSCFSPTQSPELAIDAPDAGCGCSGEEADQCVSTRYQGRAWDVALVCSEGRWRSVEDGPCFPGQPSAPATQCVVEGALYADGAPIPDPFSCNTCVCEGGQVSSCTEIGCTDPCPAGTSEGISCAVCGPTDGCEALETGCFVTCRDDAECTDPLHPICLGGQCRNACG
jgi:hypothetical protein